MIFQLKKRERDSVAIVAEVLRLACAGRVKKTSILYEVGMSHKMLGKYLRFMIDAKLLEEVPFGDRVRYRTSDKGRHFLQLYHEMMALLASDEDDRQMVLRKIQLLANNSSR